MRFIILFLMAAGATSVASAQTTETAVSTAHRLEIQTDIFAPFLTVIGSTPSSTETLDASVVITPWITIGAEGIAYRSGDQQLHSYLLQAKVYPFAIGQFNNEHFFVTGGIGQSKRRIDSADGAASASSLAYSAGTGWRVYLPLGGIFEVGLQWTGHNLPRDYRLDSSTYSVSASETTGDLAIRCMVGFAIL